MENVVSAKKFNAVVVVTPKTGVNNQGETFDYMEYAIEFKGRKIRIKVNPYDKALFKFLLEEK